MRHVNLVPKLSWYGAPSQIIGFDGREKSRSMCWITNDDGKQKYEFWLEREDEQFYFLVREFNDGSKQIIEVIKDKFDLEDYTEETE